MTDPTPYLHLPGTARQALTFYGGVFGCNVQMRSFAEFGRTDGPADAIDGQVVDRHGVHWLVGFEDDARN